MTEPDVMTAMEACIPALRRYAWALLRDRQEADDLVHDCLVQALDRLHTRRTNAELRPWLFAIMHNLFISQRRRQRVRGIPETLDEVQEASLGRAGGQEQSLLWNQTVRALAQLSEDQRAVVLLVSVEDLSYADAARALGVPIGTVMSRLSRARDRLRQLIDEGPIETRRRTK
jgi:RNA polymerase sigma-70 factor (ECF subfamily)